jgi:hypothetical protein
VRYSECHIGDGDASAHPRAPSYGMQIIRGSGGVVDLERQRLMSTRLELTARAC